MGACERRASSPGRVQRRRGATARNRCGVETATNCDLMTRSQRRANVYTTHSLTESLTRRSRAARASEEHRAQLLSTKRRRRRPNRYKSSQFPVSRYRSTTRAKWGNQFTACFTRYMRARHAATTVFR